jgi:hypothetical protein
METISTQRILVSIFTYILHFMSLVSTIVELGGTYRRFRCSSIYIHELSPVDVTFYHFQQCVSYAEMVKPSKGRCLALAQDSALS